MSELADLVRVEPSSGATQATLRQRPDEGAPDAGEAAAGLHLRPLGTSRDGRWFAVAWGGATAWLVVADGVPVQAAPRAGADDTAGLPFDWPVGLAERRGDRDIPPGWYVAVGFSEDYQPPGARRAIHTGLDLNLRTGGDADLGQPVFATGDGVVTAAGSYPVWGNIIVVRHDLPNGRALWSQYAHLQRRLVTSGQAVRRGQQVGTIGKGQRDRFAAHLHFEIRRRDVGPAFWPGLDRPTVLATYIDPRTVLGTTRLVTATGNACPLLGFIAMPGAEVPEDLVAEGGGWIGLSVAVGDDPETTPHVDLAAYEAAGLRVVVHLVPGAPAAGWDGSGPALGPGFVRAAAAAVRHMVGTPWAVLIGGDWDGRWAWPPENGPSPTRAAALFNLAYDQVRADLADAGRQPTRVGPGPMGRWPAPHDPVPFWLDFLTDVADADVLAVPAWTPGSAPDLAALPDRQQTSVGPGLNAYRALLAAVPERLRGRPALLYPVSPGVAWGYEATGWLGAVTRNVVEWNAAGRGPAVRALLVDQGRGPAVRAELARAREMGLLTDSAGAAPRRPQTWLTHSPWSGRGILVRDLWPGEGRLAVEGLGFAVLKVAHADQPWQTGPGRAATAARLAPWREAGLAAWGWGTMGGPSPELEAALAVRQTRALGLDGWVIEPLPGTTVAAATAYLACLRPAIGDLPLALLLDPAIAAEVVGALALHVHVLMPVTNRPGQAGLLAAHLGRFDRPIVPVLRGVPETSTADVASFFDLAQAARRPGAAVLAANGWPAGNDPLALALAHLAPGALPDTRKETQP